MMRGAGDPEGRSKADFSQVGEGIRARFIPYPQPAKIRGLGNSVFAETGVCDRTTNSPLWFGKLGFAN